MELKCDEDGCGGKLELDNARGEAVCRDCGVVFENMLTDADTNSGSSLGENRHNEAVPEVEVGVADEAAASTDGPNRVS